MHKSRGQGLNEYGLILGLVSIACIVPLTLVGTDLSGLFGNMIQHNASAPSPVPSLTNNTTPPAVTPVPPIPTPIVAQGALTGGAGIGGLVPPPVAGQQQACLASGICVNVPVVAKGTHVDVAGGNGGQITMQLATTLRQLAAQLEKSNADSTLVSYVTQLAQAGHDLGFTEENYTSYCDPNMGKGCTFDNSSKMGNTNMGNMTTATRTFDSLFGSLSSQALDPSVKAIISQAGQQIQTINDGYSFVQNGSTGTMQVNNNAKLIHMDANTICANGGQNCTVTLPDDSQTMQTAAAP